MFFYLVCVFSNFLLFTSANEVQIPAPSITVYDPHGIQVVLPNANGINAIFFWGNVNKELGSTDLGSIRLATFEAKDGKWVMEDDTVSLKKGDIIYYTLFVKIDGFIRKLDQMSYKITELIPNPSVTSTPSSIDGTTDKIPACSNLTTVVEVDGKLVEIKEGNGQSIPDLNRISEIDIEHCQIKLKLVPENVTTNILDIILNK